MVPIESKKQKKTNVNLLFVVILKVKMDGSSDPDQYIAIRIDC